MLEAKAVPVTRRRVPVRQRSPGGGGGGGGAGGRGSAGSSDAFFELVWKKRVEEAQAPPPPPPPPIILRPRPARLYGLGEALADRAASVAPRPGWRKRAPCVRVWTSTWTTNKVHLLLRAVGRYEQHPTPWQRRPPRAYVQRQRCGTAAGPREREARP